MKNNKIKSLNLLVKKRKFLEEETHDLLKLMFPEGIKVMVILGGNTVFGTTIHDYSGWGRNFDVVIVNDITHKLRSFNPTFDKWEFC